MGGMFQYKQFETIEELFDFAKEQAKCAKGMGLYLLSAEIWSLKYPMIGYEWTAYFSK